MEMVLHAFLKLIAAPIVPRFHVIDDLHVLRSRAAVPVLRTLEHVARFADLVAAPPSCDRDIISLNTPEHGYFEQIHPFFLLHLIHGTCHGDDDMAIRRFPLIQIIFPPVR